MNLNSIYSDHDSGDESANRDNPYCFSSCNSIEIEKPDKSVTRTRRRKSSSEKGNRVCVVCGEKASGFNFDRLTCESCKAFFRRNAMKPKEKMKPCPQGGGCNVTGSQRKHCPYCRLEKCFAEGMKKELILPPEKLEQRAKPKRRKTNQELQGTSGDNKIRGSDSCVKSESMYTTHEKIKMGSSFSRAESRSSATSEVGACRKDECTTPPPSLSVMGGSEAGIGVEDVGRGNSPDVDGSSSRHQQYMPTLSVSSDDDRGMLASLAECVSKLKEPFTPQEHPPDTETAQSLEEAYNRMDTCIRRIIRLVKLLPCFFRMDKQMQLTLLRTNIYGLIIIYSSFFFEKEIKKLCYPVLTEDGNVHLVTVSVSPSDLGFSSDKESGGGGLNASVPMTGSSGGTIETGSYTSTLVGGYGGSGSLKQAVQEDFELYKENTIAAFTELQELTLDDNVLKVLILVIKLFDHDNVPASMREQVRRTRNKYSAFLMRYLRAKHQHRGLTAAQHSSNSQHSRKDSFNNNCNSIAILHFTRMLMSFIDICTLELRMIEFSKLLSLDGLSPLMREVCSHRAAVVAAAGDTGNGTGDSGNMNQLHSVTVNGANIMEHHQSRPIGLQNPISQQQHHEQQHQVHTVSR